MKTVNRFEKPIAYLLIAVVLAVLFFTLYYLGMQPRVLYPSEVRNFEGQNLASIADVRENAIRGTQNLNTSSYRLNIS